jgi:hypothetical protein
MSRLYAGVFAAVGWFAIVGQFFLTPTSAGNYFSYFTILSNVLVALTLTSVALAPGSGIGWTKQFDHILHYVVPPAYVLFWLAFVRKGTLHVGSIPWMLIAPLAYGVYTLARGPFVGWYPYPFIDVTDLGYPHVFRNIVEFVVFFGFVSSIYVLIDRLAGRLRTAAA